MTVIYVRLIANSCKNPEDTFSDERAHILLEQRKAMSDSRVSEAVSKITVSTTPYSLRFDDSDDGMGSVSSERSFTDGVDVLSPVESPSNFLDWSRLQAARIVTNRIFKRGILASISATCFILGLGAASAKPIPLFHPILNCFQLLFSLEIALNFIFLQKDSIKAGWFVFDVFCVALSFIFRPELLILRGFKLIRALRRASFMTDLKVVVRAVLKVLPKLGAITILLAAQLFIFGVLFTHLFRDTNLDAFLSLEQTLWSLVRILTLDDWTALVEDVMSIYPWSPILFLLFLLSTTLILGSLVVAVMVQAVLSTQHDMYWKNFNEKEHTCSDDKVVLEKDRNLKILMQQMEDLIRRQERLADRQDEEFHEK